MFANESYTYSIHIGVLGVHLRKNDHTRRIRPGLRRRFRSETTPHGEDTNYDGDQLDDLDQCDDRDADPEAELTADVRDESNEIIVRRLRGLDDVAVSYVNDDSSQQVSQLRRLQCTSVEGIGPYVMTLSYYSFYSPQLYYLRCVILATSLPARLILVNN